MQQGAVRCVAKLHSVSIHPHLQQQGKNKTEIATPVACVLLHSVAEVPSSASLSKLPVGFRLVAGRHAARVGV